MNKNQFSRILANKLDLLEESNITELIEKGNYKEANYILSQLEYKTLSSYIKDKNQEALDSVSAKIFELETIMKELNSLGINLNTINQFNQTKK